MSKSRMLDMKKDADAPLLGRPREFDTDAALDHAMQLFWRKGFLGTSLSDLTNAMGITRPSLYAAFGNKESLFLRALDHYFRGPSSYLRECLGEPTARAVADRLMHSVVDLVSKPGAAKTCLWVHGALSCGGESGSLHAHFGAQRAEGHSLLRARFRRGIADGDLLPGTDVAALASFVQSINFGLAVQAATGASRKELIGVVATAMRAWPK